MPAQGPRRAPCGIGGPQVSRARPAAILCSLIAGGVLLLSGSQPWLRVDTTMGEGMPRVAAGLAASTVAPGVIAGGFVLLAGGGALLVVRRLGAALVGGVLIVAATASAVVAARFGMSDPAIAAEQLRSALLAPPVALITAERTAAWLIALLGGLLGAAAGSLAIAAARQWRGLAPRFRPLAGAHSAGPHPVTTALTPTPPVSPVPPLSAPPGHLGGPAGAAATEVAALWDEQDAGRDPTDSTGATIRS